jgi:hypothetical protein
MRSDDRIMCCRCGIGLLHLALSGIPCPVHCRVCSVYRLLRHRRSSAFIGTQSSLRFLQVYACATMRVGGGTLFAL